jgi:hypothetical protein
MLTQTRTHHNFPVAKARDTRMTRWRLELDIVKPLFTRSSINPAGYDRQILVGHLAWQSEGLAATHRLVPLITDIRPSSCARRHALTLASSLQRHGAAPHIRLRSHTSIAISNINH